MPFSNNLLIPCPNCGVTPNPKAGFEGGLQRFFCRKCDVHYTVKTPKLLKRRYWFSEEQRTFAVQLYIMGYFPQAIIDQFKVKYARDLSREVLYSWLSKAGIKPKLRSFQLHLSAIIKACPRCGYEGTVLRCGFVYSGKQKYGCRQCGTIFTDDHVCGEPVYSEPFKEMAVRLYTSEPSLTLDETAKILNDKYHFCPPLSYDSIGRWVEAVGLMKPKPQQGHNRWLKRKEKYGPKGVNPEKLKNLSKWRTTLWADPEYKERMSAAMRHPKKTVLSEVVKL